MSKRGRSCAVQSLLDAPLAVWRQYAPAPDRSVSKASADVTSSYSDAIDSLLASRKRKPSFDFASLDRKVRDGFAAPLAHADGYDASWAADIMLWKLSRGQFRPGLLQQLNANSQDNISKAIGEARGLLEQTLSIKDANPADDEARIGFWMKAVDRLAQLKGIGPATATAVLMAIRLKEGEVRVPFFADEAAAIVLKKPIASLKYSRGELLTFFQGLLQIRRTVLARAADNGHDDDDTSGLDPSDMSHALWAHAILHPT